MASADRVPDGPPLPARDDLLTELLREVRALHARLDALAPLPPTVTAKLHPCERDLMAVLAPTTPGRRMTGSEVMNALARRGLRWSYRTVARGLARLVRIGELNNSKRTPQGYWMARSQ